MVPLVQPENTKVVSGKGLGPQGQRRSRPSAGKVIAMVFSDAKGVIMLDFYSREV